jgi:DNA-binding transcriptional regulator YiaG
MAPPNRIAELRRASKLSARQVGLHLDTTERTIYRWERGEGGIPDDQKLALADFFGVTVGWLMGWENGDNGERSAA